MSTLTTLSCLHTFRTQNKSGTVSSSIAFSTFILLHQRKSVVQSWVLNWVLRRTNIAGTDPCSCWDIFDILSHFNFQPALQKMFIYSKFLFVVLAFALPVRTNILIMILLRSGDMESFTRKFLKVNAIIAHIRQYGAKLCWSFLVHIRWSVSNLHKTMAWGAHEPVQMRVSV